MKRYLFGFAVLLLAAGCKESPVETIRTDVLKEFDAPQISLETKAAIIPEGGKFVWEKGDGVIVDNGSETALFTYNSSRGVFVTERDDFSLADNYKAIFPASAYSASSAPGEPEAEIGQDMEVYPGFLKNLPMRGSAGKDARFTFTPLFAPVRVDFPQDRIPGGNPGDVSKVLFTSSLGNRTYNCAKGVNVSQEIYIAIPVGTYKGGVSFTFTMTDGTSLELGCGEDLVVRAGAINLTRLLRPFEAFSGGDGSTENPYIINSVGDFIEFVEKCSSDNSFLSKNYRQEADIDLDGNWDFKPLGSRESPFTGSYDGGSHCIRSGVWNTVSGGDATGLFRCVEGAAIRNLKLEDWTLTSKEQFLGGFAGIARNSTFENCEWKGTLRQSAKAPMQDFESVTDNANFGIAGGIAAFAEGCAFDGCNFSGLASSTGKALGGIAGYSRNCVFRDCSTSTGSELCSMYHCVGGIAGAMTRNRNLEGESLVENCSAAGNMSAFDHCGGIVGYLQNGTVRRCVVSSKATVTGRQFNIGGIAGFVIPKDGETCLIDRCTVYCDVTGQYCVGGITGYVDCNDAGGRAWLTNCTYTGGTLSATGTNDYRYALVGGIAGWITKSREIVIENCLSAPKLIRTAVQNAPEASLRECIGGVAGLVGFNNNDNGETFLSNNCTRVSFSTFQHRYKVLSAFSDFTVWGAALGRSSKLGSLANNFFCSDNELRGIADGQAGGEYLTGLTLAQMTDGTLLNSLNAALGSLKLSGDVEMSRWKSAEDGFPCLECSIADPSPRGKTTLRVSILGDSISSFAGYTPAGYNYHYPCADGSVTRVEQTWWHQLIYRKMKDARLDVNMSYSGSAVANSDEAAGGSRKDHWCNNSYVQRYIRLGGIGDPDIVLIHGGTNDWAHADFCPLYPGSEDCGKAAAPSPSDLQNIYNSADAAQTREQIEALLHNDFCSAYVKLICLIKNQYPDARIVCVIGDYLSEGIEKSIIAIANHYGAKYVDLLAVNGFNDQVYMPKHDYNGTSGCHPDARAMTFIADKIYEETGAWLEE